MLAQNPNPSLEEISGLLDGNICRCTGYRPIFAAFQSLSPEAPPELKKKLADIEDLISKENGNKFKCPRYKTAYFEMTFILQIYLGQSSKALCRHLLAEKAGSRNNAVYQIGRWRMVEADQCG